MCFIWFSQKKKKLLVFVMETQCPVCEVGSDLQYDTGVTAVENSTEGIVVNEWRYTEAVKRFSVVGRDGGGQVFLAQPSCYWTPILWPMSTIPKCL
jgi:hypothetical protein